MGGWVLWEGHGYVGCGMNGEMGGIFVGERRRGGLRRWWKEGTGRDRRVILTGWYDVVWYVNVLNIDIVDLETLKLHC